MWDLFCLIFSIMNLHSETDTVVWKIPITLSLSASWSYADDNYALIVNIYKRATTSSSIKHASFNNIMYEGEVHYATWELKIRMYLSSSYTKFCILAFMSGFTEAVTILKSVNDLAQKIILQPYHPKRTATSPGTCIHR